MRLTLRTLLAYMDDVLDPADQEDLSRKIEMSPFATELIHRSRDAVRRLRLSAPDPMAGSDDDIHGGDSALDANMAAEYLDNTLAPDAVADFERSCLEAGANADMLLAEAASCHHVLTMVLGEPAEVDADLRQRMYALSQSPAAAPQQLRIEPGHAAHKPATVTTVTMSPVGVTAAAVPVGAAAVAPARAARVQDDDADASEYILAAARERRRGRRIIMGVLTAAALLGGVATWMVMTSGEAKIPDEIAGMGGVDALSEGPTVSEAEGPATTSDTGDTDTDEVTAAAAGDENSVAPPFVPGATTASEAPPTEATVTGELGTGELATSEPPVVMLPPQETRMAETPSVGPPATGDVAAVTLPPETPAAPAEADVAASEPPADAAAAPAGVGPTGDVAATAASSTPPGPPLASSTPGATAVTGPAAAASGAGPIAAGAVAPPTGDAPMIEPVDGAASTDMAAAAAAPKPIGAYLGNNDVLLKHDAAENVWVRLSPRTALTGGEQLLALPTFRTHVVLADMNAYLSGGAQIDLVPPAEGAEVALHIPYGQLVLNSGLNGNRVELSLVDQTRTVQLGSSSSLAVEVRRVFEPGGGLKREPAPAEVTWYLTSGSATWGNSASAEAPATWTTSGGEDSAPAAVDELPEWVDNEPISDVERRARERVAGALVPGEPVNIHLLELSDPNDRGRRTEDRALAARSGAYVGLYDALVTSLGDVNQRAAWGTQIDALRQAIARDPSAVEGIRAAFAIERGQDAADDLMEMLLGFDRAAVGTTREEVQQGALVRILRWMDNDDLTTRVLASHNADEILGRRDTGGYKPEQSASQRKRLLGRLWEKLERGELMPPEARPST